MKYKGFWRLFPVLLLYLFCIFHYSNVCAELQNLGENGEYFYDTDSGLYWWDPEKFQGWPYEDIEEFLDKNPFWKWANSDEIDGLVGKSSEGSIPLNQIMGQQQFNTGYLVNGIWYSGFRWIGYYDNTPENPDGWLVQTYFDAGPPVENDLTTLGESGFQNYVDAWPHGAWLNSYINPLSQSIDSPYVNQPPKLDGKIDFGEWPDGATIHLDNGFIKLANDRTRLYILIDLTDDTQDDSNDYFWLTFDVNQNGIIDAELDKNYNLHPYNGNMRYQYYLGPGHWTGLQNETFSAKAKGFGCFFADGSLRFTTHPFQLQCSRHRVWELAIDLAEIDSEAGGTARMGLRVRSTNPGFTEELPENFSHDFSNLITINLSHSHFITFAPSPFAYVHLTSKPLEITQAIQDRDNSMPLVADKKTVARVYAQTDKIYYSQPCIVSLYGSIGDEDLPGSPLALFHSAPLTISRENIYSTANFQIPDSWTNGNVRFRAVVRDLFERKSEYGPITLTFTETRTPTYWIVPVNMGSEEHPTLPDDAEISEQENFLETVFPVADVKFVRKPWETIGATPSSSQVIPKLNDVYRDTFLAWVFGLLFTGHPPFDMPNQIFGFTPWGGGLSDPAWAGGLGHVARGFRGTSREATMAHEITHNLGPGDCNNAEAGFWGRHVSSLGRLSQANDPSGQCISGDTTVYGCNAAGPDPLWQELYDDHEIHETGLDTSQWPPRVVPSDTPEIMSYCGSGTLPTKWISTYRWTRMLNYFAVSKAVANVKADDIQDVYYISGTVKKDGGGRLDPVLTAPGTPLEGPGYGDYMIGLYGIKGETLHKMYFPIAFMDVEGNPRDTVAFSFRIPAPDTQVASVVLSIGGEKILDEIVISRVPPRVNIVTPNGGEEWDDTGYIQWSGFDEDHDALTYSLFYSPDDGGTWIPLASDLHDDWYKFPTSVIPGSERARVRVIATDGFNTVQDDSDEPFKVAFHRPRVIILEPEDGSVLELKEMITFRGSARHPDESSLPDEAFVWTYDSNIPFGLGRTINAALPKGEHVVTLTVLDDHGNTATDSVNVLVIHTFPGDFEPDGDVDGADLSALSRNPRLLDVRTFAEYFGSTQDDVM